MKHKQQQPSDDSIVLALIRRYQKPGDGMLWTSRMIAEHTGLDPQRASVVLRRLVQSGQLVEKEGSYKTPDNPTTIGGPGPTSGGFYVFRNGSELDRAAAQAVLGVIQSEIEKTRNNGKRPTANRIAWKLGITRNRFVRLARTLGLELD